jgi:hypothetical protein
MEQGLASARVFQLQALVPAPRPDGVAVAMVEFSTPFVASGAQGRTLLVTAAASVRFTELATAPCRAEVMC